MLNALALDGPPPPTLDLAPWHVGREHLVASALADVTHRAPHLARLARLILPRAPRKVLATSTLKTASASSGVMLLDDAVQEQHIGIRTPTHAYAVAVDCDHNEWAERLDELEGYGVPRPTWTAPDPWTGRAHLVWWLRSAVVLTEAGRKGPVRLLDAVFRLLTAAIGGDPAYTGTLTRNPWAPGPATMYSGLPPMPDLWESHRITAPHLRHAVIPNPVLHTLESLRIGLQAWQDATDTALPGRRRRAANAEDGERGRKVFDALRHRVYAAWPCSAQDVEGMAAETVAALGSPISPKQLAGMARRMHAWCSRNYTARRTAAGCDINRGRDRLEMSGLDLPEKQAVAGRRTSQAVRDRTVDKLRSAADSIIASGAPLTRATLAAAAAMSPRTVQRWWRDIEGGGDKRCPSGIAPFSGAPLASSPENPSSLALLAEKDALVRRTAAALAAESLMIERRRAETRAAAELRRAEAHARAQEHRLAAARAARADARTRREDFEARLRADGTAARTWWRAHVADLDTEWDAREMAADPGELPYVEARRRGVIVGRWRSWRAAVRTVAGVPRHARETVEGEIPW